MEYKKTIGQTLEALMLEARPNGTLFQRWQYRAPGIPAFTVRSDALLNSLIEFETKLAEATPDPEDAQDITKSYNPLSLEETRALLPQVSIPYLISQRSPNYVPNKIIVGSPPYLKAVSQILLTTDKPTIQAYLVWKTVQAYGVNIESDALKPLHRFNNRLRGKDPEATEERWRTCVKHVDSGLGQLLIPVDNKKPTNLRRLAPEPIIH
jgi:endothelin-converting enzyme